MSAVIYYNTKSQDKNDLALSMAERCGRKPEIERCAGLLVISTVWRVAWRVDESRSSEITYRQFTFWNTFRIFSYYATW